MWKALKQVFSFYIDGFRDMTLGKTLWLIILLKLFILFFVLKFFFFPDFLSSQGVNGDKDDYISSELIKRTHNINK